MDAPAQVLHITYQYDGERGKLSQLWAFAMVMHDQPESRCDAKVFAVIYVWHYGMMPSRFLSQDECIIVWKILLLQQVIRVKLRMINAL